jgi:hypothetical protein
LLIESCASTPRLRIPAEVEEVQCHSECEHPSDTTTCRVVCEQIVVSRLAVLGSVAYVTIDYLSYAH